MSARLIVNSDNQLEELIEDKNSKPVVLRVIAKILSVLFHPVFVPVYIILFLLYVDTSVFVGFTPWNRTVTLLQAILMYGFFPLVTVLLLKAVGFIKSIYLQTQRDRIIPYTACMIWYFWIWYVWKNLPGSPREIVFLGLSVFLASIIGLMGNIYLKISMHAIAMGVMLTFMTLLGLSKAGGFGLYLAATVLIVGLVCTSRFLVSNHTQKEIYLGLFSGIFVSVIAFFFS